MNAIAIQIHTQMGNSVVLFNKKLITTCVFFVSMTSCDATNEYGERVTSQGDLVERDLVFLDCKLKNPKGYEATINPRQGVIFDRANNALKTYGFRVFLASNPSMDDYYVKQIDRLLKQPVTSYNHNIEWRYGEPRPSDVNVWQTLNIRELSWEFVASEGSAYELHRDTLELHQLFGRKLDPVIRQCTTVDSWESLRALTMGFLQTVREEEAEYQATKEAANKI